ncbi:MAG: hypothetical protein KJ718_02875 [Nanoarchaeota archaeon]|nr:hypothetical protein [Nanoarchaeota archaeon]MBU1051472.1 hypothetical protein [Nanoarchaeota archaeon]MBU1988413.1 hypothetical protein [Nanoarchaeota archaeon]
MDYENLKIVGSKKFKDQTTKALNLIKKNSKRDFNKINKYLKKIRFAKRSCLILEKAQFDVGAKTAYHSLEWYASTIIHDTHHYYLHAIKKFPWKKENITGHEKLCIKEQVRFLKKIKAQKKMIDYTKNSPKSKYWLNKKEVW